MFTTQDYTPVPSADMPSNLHGPTRYGDDAKRNDKATISALTDKQLLKRAVGHALDAGMQYNTVNAGYYAERAQFWFTALYRRAFGG